MSISLEAKGIVQTQGAERNTPAMFQVDLSWVAPKIHVIMGASGCGKSTLLKTLGGVWKPNQGHLLLGQQKLWTDSRLGQNHDVLRRIGFTFQNNALFSSMSALENLCFPHRQRFPEIPEEKRRSLALEWLEKVGLSHAAQQLPHELSGGMQKRLGIARTLILKPDYIFLDDPTAGLDPITSKSIAELVLELLGKTEALSIIVTNDPDRAAQWTQDIHYLHNRKLISRGDPDYQKIQRIYS